MGESVKPSAESAAALTTALHKYRGGPNRVAAALLELVECKDLIDSLEKDFFSDDQVLTVDQRNDGRAEYKRRKPLAWEEARAALIEFFSSAPSSAAAATYPDTVAVPRDLLNAAACTINRDRWACSREGDTDGEEAMVELHDKISLLLLTRTTSSERLTVAPSADCIVPREILERIRPAVKFYALHGAQAALKCQRGELPAHYKDTLQRDELERDALLCAVDDILSVKRYPSSAAPAARVTLQTIEGEMTVAQAQSYIYTLEHSASSASAPADRRTTGSKVAALTARCEGLPWEQAGPQYQVLAEELERDLEVSQAEAEHNFKNFQAQSFARAELQRSAESATGGASAVEVLDKVIASLKDASERRYQVLKECEAEAHKWKAEGDMYGWNYHAGRAGGCNESDIIYCRALRLAEDLRKEVIAADRTPPEVK